MLQFILLFSASGSTELLQTHLHTLTHAHTQPSHCLWGCALKPVNLFHLSTLWLVHPHSASLTISPAPGCSLILYPTKADNLSKTYLSLLYSISGSSYFFFFFFIPILRGGSSFESTLGGLTRRSQKLYNTGGKILPDVCFERVFDTSYTSHRSWHCSLSHSLPHSSSCSTHPPFVISPFHLHVSNFLHSHLLILSAIFQLCPHFIFFLFRFVSLRPVISHNTRRGISSFCHTYKW